MTVPGQDQAVAPPAEGRRGTAATRSRGRISVAGVLGELLITAGVFVLLFLGWQQWLNDIIVGTQLHNHSVQQSQTWNKAAVGPTKAPQPDAPPVITATIPACIQPLTGTPIT